MRKLRNALLVATGMVFGACATQTFRPEDAPEYVVTRDPTPFYLSKPQQEGTPDAALSAETRVKLLRKEASYSLVLLDDSRRGYVGNAYLTQAPPGSQQRGTESTRPRRRAAPSPTPAASQPAESPAPEAGAPATSTPSSPDAQAPPEEVPSPTPAPEAPLEKPKFRL